MCEWARVPTRRKTGATGASGVTPAENGSVIATQGVTPTGIRGNTPFEGFGKSVTLYCSDYKSFQCCVSCHWDREEAGAFDPPSTTFRLVGKDFRPYELRSVGCHGFGEWVVLNLEKIEDGKIT